MAKTYPDVEAVLARLEAEAAPAHVRAQRLAELHIAMAEASHNEASEALAQIRYEVQSLPIALKALREDCQVATRRNAEAIAALEARLSALSSAVETIRQQMGAIGQPLAYPHYILAGSTGALVGILLGVRMGL